MEAGASLRALHATVTGEEVAAHAEGKAVSPVLADKLVWADTEHGVGGVGRLVWVIIVQPALDALHVHDLWVLSVGDHLVDLLQPFHLAVAHEVVPAESKLGQRI